MSRYLVLTVPFLWAFAGISAGGAAQTLGPPETVAAAEEGLFSAPTLARGGLVAAVLARNPTLDAVRQGWTAATERRVRAGSLEDPTLRYVVAPASVGTGVRFGQEVELAQRLPFPGKLRLREEAAGARAEAAGEVYQTARLDLAALASALFDDYYVLHRAREINEQHVTLLEGLQRVATARYAAGAAAQQDPLQAEVELAHLLHRRVVLDSARKILTARINALLHRSPEAPLPPAPATLPDPEWPLPEIGTLRRDAEAARPELRALAAELRGLEAELALARLDLKPDLEAMSSYNSMWDDREHRWMAGLRINLPVRRQRLRAAIGEAEALLAGALGEREGLLDDVRAGILEAHARLEEAHHVWELYRDRTLPATRDQVQAALAGFKAGRAIFPTVIEAERNLRTVELAYHEALAECHRRRAELDRAGGRLPGAPSSAGGDDPSASEGSGVTDLLVRDVRSDS